MNFSPFFRETFFKRDTVDLHEKIGTLSYTHLLLLISSSIPKSGHEPGYASEKNGISVLIKLNELANLWSFQQLHGPHGK
jgi:hypothetical protein